MAHTSVVEVLYPYSAAEKNQISLQPRERITVLEKDKSGWWIGRRDATGEVGIFPSTYVREIPDRLKFNRPKELKPLSVTSPGQEGQKIRGDKKDARKDWKTELGLEESDSGEEGSPVRGQGGMDPEAQRDLRRRLAELTRVKDDLEKRFRREQDERCRAEKLVKDFKRQIAILKQTNIVMHEKSNQLRFDLEEAHEMIRTDGKVPASPPYRQEPDEAVRGWLEAAIKERCDEDRARIRELERQVETLEDKLNEDSEEDSILSPEKKSKGAKSKADSPKPLARQHTQPQIEPSSQPSGRIRKGDWVRLLKNADEPEPGVLASGAEGFVIDIVAADEVPDGKPFCVRGPGDPKLASRTWFSESVLEFIRAEPLAPASALPASAPDADAMKDKDKKIKKMEKKVKVLEEDLSALEKYNGKLEKKMEKLKKQVASG
eukprot:Hpha_TRINITY_DN16153_c2_g1::TRINITY_DN16153_c2_g1_i1::g.4229::m.4229